MTTSTSNSGLLRPAITLFVIFTIITGICYPLAVTGIAMVCFPHQADGSLIVKDGKPIGSELIGQEFAASSDPKYLWGRLSATSPVPYTSFNADKLTGSSGSNLGPTNPALIANVQSRLDALKAADTAAGYTRPAGQLVPADLVTSSASGLDPHISPAAADYQIPRIAKARNLPEAAVRDIVARNTRQRQLGFLGEPVVDVLQTNLALDTAR